MADLPSLESLGHRICILGPSNSGKSILAHAIHNKTQLPLIHLDQLYHLPYTNWLPRPFDEFLELHHQAVTQERWVMEGNYTKTLDERLEYATGFILLDCSTIQSLIRYCQRVHSEKHRIGALAGNQDSIKWQMIHHITCVTPNNRKCYQAIFNNLLIPKCYLSSFSELQDAYQTWNLIHQPPVII